MIHTWQVTQEKVQAAIEKIVAISQPRKIILFGSYVRGKNGDTVAWRHYYRIASIIAEAKGR